MILDAAGQKETGKWTLMAALDAGEPLPLIGEAVFACCLSAVKGLLTGARIQKDGVFGSAPVTQGGLYTTIRHFLVFLTRFIRQPIFKQQLNRGCFRRIMNGRIIISSALIAPHRSFCRTSLPLRFFLGNTKSTFAIAQVCQNSLFFGCWK